MTQTMLERAARAAWERSIATGREDLPYQYVNRFHVDIARAVLMAVREPSEAMPQAVQTTEGWEDMIDFVLNEPQR